MATQKCSDRRAVLNRAVQLMHRLMLLNEEAARMATELTDAGVVDVGDTVNKLLGAGGPVATDDTISKEIQSILDGTTTDPVHGAIAWEWVTE